MTAVAPEPAVAVLYTIIDTTGLVTGSAAVVAVRAIRGISMPLLVEVISSFAAGVVVPTPTFWLYMAVAMDMAIATRVIIFFIKMGGGREDREDSG